MVAPTRSAQRRRGAPLVRTVTVSLAAAAVTYAVVATFWLMAHGSWVVVTSGAPAQASDLLLVLLCGAGTAVSAWLGAGFVCATLAALPGALGVAAAAAAERVAPVAVRRVAAVVVGATLAVLVVPATQALADGVPGWTLATGSGSGHPGGPVGPVRAPLLAPDPAFGVDPSGPVDPAFRPTEADQGGAPRSSSSTSPPTPPATTSTPAPTSTPQSTPQSVPAPPPAPPARSVPSLGPLGPAPATTPSRRNSPAGPTRAGSVTVVRGDTLWAIAARHLGAHATHAQITREWRRWYAANRTVIGADPDLIRVGQVLRRPPAAAPQTAAPRGSAATQNGPSR